MNRLIINIKNKKMMKSLIFAMIMMKVNAIYFFLEPGMERCFKDEVVKNYVSINNLKK